MALVRKFLLEKPLDKNQKIGFIFSPQLGDSLISMVVVHNLRRNGYDVTVFSDHMFSMKHWFSNDNIHPYPNRPDFKLILSNYDVLFCVYLHDIPSDTKLWHPNIIILDQSPLIKSRQLVVDALVNICREDLHLIDLVRTNDLTPPKGLDHHKYSKRIIIHPSSRESFRSWPQHKFIKLVKKLNVIGYDPIFIVSPAEHQDWLIAERQGCKVVTHIILDEVANFIYESGWFIGNDSGLGHLASNLGLNTLTLMVRPGLARLWRPSWMPGKVILPPWWLITRKLKEKFWGNFISIKRVLNVFLNQKSTYRDIGF